MHVTVRPHEGGASLVCELCGQQCDVPPTLTPGPAFNAFVALHPATDHEPAECPDWDSTRGPST